MIAMYVTYCSNIIYIYNLVFWCMLYICILRLRKLVGVILFWEVLLYFPRVIVGRNNRDIVTRIFHEGQGTLRAVI